MDRRTELKLLAQALDEGLLDEADIRRIEEEASSADHTLRPGHWGWRIDLLVQRGVLTDDDVRHLERKISARPPSRGPGRHVSHGPSHASVSALTTPSPTPRPSFSEIPEGWERYRVVELIGEGGMGRVYRAVDPRLRRWVALKFLHGDDPALVERFLAEARTQASIEHDNVCPIYEVGEVEGRPYIAMQLIRGESLAECARRLSMEERLRLVRDVALALHAAHEHGLVHRDVKPANILVERTPDGKAKPYVVDFGLAREVTAPSVTATGAILGTVAFMAPEQAGADKREVDHRADIYSLGATLYDALAGHPPFTGSSLEIIVKLAGEDPPPLSRTLPGVPRDVEAIVMKCLRRSPEERYATARELAEDLERYLAGEPVHARPVTFVDRGRSWVRRNRLASAALAALLLTLLSSAGWVGLSTWRASRQAYFARKFTQETSRIENRVRMITARPLHDTTTEFRQLRRYLQDLERQVKAAGGAARGPGEYALGRGYLALGDYATAERHLASAWRHGYREPEASFAWGLALANLYRMQHETAQRLQDPEARRRMLRQAEMRYRDPALRLLEAGRTTDVEAPEYGEALIALLEGDYDTVVAKCRQAVERIPWLYAARRLEGDAEMARANIAREEGKPDEAIQALRRAEAAFEAAVQLAPSDPATHEGLCTMWDLRALVLVDQGADPAEAFGQADASCHRALTADPVYTPALASLAFANLQLGEYQALHGEDPAESIQEAAGAAERGLKVQPHNGMLLTYAGLAMLEMGRNDAALGRDPRKHFEEASRELAEALKEEPRSKLALNSLGLLWLERAFWELGHGVDVDPSLDRSIQYFGQLAAQNPGSFVALDNLGVAYWVRAHTMVDRGRDPEDAVTSAENHLQQAISSYPRDWAAYNNRGLVRAERARYALLLGEDPRPFVTPALGDYEAARKLNAANASIYTNMAGAHWILAEFAAASGGDPAAETRAAVSAARHAISINPMDAEAWLNLARAELALARHRLEAGTDPTREIRTANEALEKSLGINPAYVEAMVERAEAKRLTGAWKLRTGGDPAPEVDDALRWADAALEHNPNWAFAHAEKARLLRLQLRAGPPPQHRRQLEELAHRESIEAERLNPLLREASHAPAGAGRPST